MRARHLQYLLAFSYWPVSEPRGKSHIYELRSYRLKPGTMIEWGNNWARAINFRKTNNEAYAGFFSQIGRLYNVHHFWCYENYQQRKETREFAWSQPGELRQMYFVGIMNSEKTNNKNDLENF